MGAARPVLEGGPWLGPLQQLMVAQSDTFFIATCSSFHWSTPCGFSPSALGADVSNRGGPRGFVSVHSGAQGTNLTWADYVGNNMFNSIGNLLTNPNAGLLFIDFSNGDTLQLTGQATVDFDDTSLPGAQRSMTFTVARYIHVTGALPVSQLGPIGWSPFNPEPPPPALSYTLAPAPAGPPSPPGPGAGGAESVRCVGVEVAAEGIKTFTFQLPSSLQPMGRGTTGQLPYLAGQYATFLVPVGSESSPLPTRPVQSAVPGETVQGGAAQGATVQGTVQGATVQGGAAQGATVQGTVQGATVQGTVQGATVQGTVQGATVQGTVQGAQGVVQGLQRTWTVSSHPSTTSSKGTFTITVKRVGLVSGWMHDHLVPDTLLQFKGFAGEFTADLAGSAPLGVLLLAGGIGITPLRPILQDLPASPAPPRQVVLVYWVQRLEQAALATELHQVAEAAGRGKGVHVRLVLATTQQQPEAILAHPRIALGPLWRVASGRASSALLQQVLSVEAGEGVGGAKGAGVSLRGWHTFMCGPPAFMANAETAVAELGADVGTDLHSESFAF